MLKKILIRIFLIVIGFCLIIVVITSTTGFEIQKNPMEYFFSQHELIDSLHLDDSIPRQLVINDIEFLINTIEEVHPDPFYSIAKIEFNYMADSIKQLLQEKTSRKDLLNVLTPLLQSLNDGHTSIKFPEISKGQDNLSNFEKAHGVSIEIVSFDTIDKNTGYLSIKDFAMDKKDFAKKLEIIFEQIKKDSLTTLIIDIRNNPGGNSELADILISYIHDKPYKANSKIIIKRSEQYYSYLKGYFSWWVKPFLMFVKQINEYKNTPINGLYEDIKGFKKPIHTTFRFSGKKYLLINSNTFSTALCFATVFKDYDIGEIVGEPTKSEVNEFGDIYPFDLPNSRLWVWCSAKRYIRPSGEMTKGGLQPDILVDDDKILKKTIDLIGKHE